MARGAAFVSPFAMLALMGACKDDSTGGDPGVLTDATPTALAQGVAFVDDDRHRVVLMNTKAGGDVNLTPFPVGHDVVTSAVSPDGSHLFVLSAGDLPRRTATDQNPSLSVLSVANFAGTMTKFDMSEPLGGLAVDPEGHWLVAYATPSDKTSFVQNPNEIILFDLTAPPSATNPVTRTLRSFGGQPQRLTFTPQLQLPSGPRRLLLIESDQDVTILDLNHALDNPPRPEITVPLTSGQNGAQLVPAGLVVDDGDPTRNDDARVALRTTSDSSVFTLLFTAGEPGHPNDFSLKLNLTDVGGVPADIAFVRTDAGIRLAALVARSQTAVLIDPTTSVTTSVSLPTNYSHMVLVTNEAQGTAAADAGAPAASTDVALLWAPNAGGASEVAIWSLGQTAGQSYRSVETVGVSEPLTRVDDVPNQKLKVLERSDGGGFIVLDLTTHTASPLTTSSSASLVIAPDGGHVIAFAQNSTSLSTIDFARLHPIPLSTERPIKAVFDVANQAGGRSIVALHAAGTSAPDAGTNEGMGVTVFDAITPDTATAKTTDRLATPGDGTPPH